MFSVIIVDDDCGTSNNLGNYFPWEEHGFKVIDKFYDGYSAYQFLKLHNVDLVISDIKMPIMDGIEIAKWLHEQHRKEKLIFISGYKDFDFAQKALEYGVSYYCLKPVTYSEMKQKLASIKTMLEQGKNDKPIEKTVAEESIQMKQICRCKDYIKANYKEVSLEDIAEYMKMNASYLSRFFKELTQTNLYSYIQQVRMKKALEFLQNEEYRTIYEIGEKVGYSNQISFTKIFRKYYGITPTEYRKKFTSIQKEKEYE